jgi:3-phosphoinositide dependent protein kinase-1
MMGENRHSNDHKFLSCETKGSTFVGTAEYVSPEILLDQASGPPSDLWALGCIIYKLFTGNTPFKGANDFHTFQQIVKGDVLYGADFPLIAKDICEKLLVIDPNKRLGSGPPGSVLSFEMLKKHGFFKEIDFATLASAHPKVDSAMATTIRGSKKIPFESGYESPTEPTTNPTDGGDDEDDDDPSPQIMPATQQSTKGEKMIKEGVVDKKCGWLFFYNRKLVLTNAPRLSYYDPKTNKYKVFLISDIVG